MESSFWGGGGKQNFLSLGHFQYQALLKADDFSIRVQTSKAQQKTEMSA